jgi:hypothetical protein
MIQNSDAKWTYHPPELDSPTWASAADYNPGSPPVLLKDGGRGAASRRDPTSRLPLEDWLTDSQSRPLLPDFFLKF